MIIHPLILKIKNCSCRERESKIWIYKSLVFLFQLLSVALSLNIYSLYSIKQKQKKFADFKIFFCSFSKFFKNKKLLNTNFYHSKTFTGVTWGPTKHLGPISSAVLTFIGYKQTDKQTNKQTDKPNLYIEYWSDNGFKGTHVIRACQSINGGSIKITPRIKSMRD